MKQAARPCVIVPECYGARSRRTETRFPTVSAPYRPTSGRSAANFLCIRHGALLADRGCDQWKASTRNAEAPMSEHRSFEIVGVLKGAADGPLAIGTLALIALAATARLWLRRD